MKLVQFIQNSKHWVTKVKSNLRETKFEKYQKSNKDFFKILFFYLEWKFIKKSFFFEEKIVKKFVEFSVFIVFGFEGSFSLLFWVIC